MLHLHKNKNSLAAFALLVLASCGGGGGGGAAPSSSGGGGSVVVASDIDATNAGDAALIGISLIEAPLQLVGLVADTIDTLVALDAPSLSTTCRNDGSIDFDFTDADLDGVPSPGDSLRADFRQCYQRSLDTVVDGAAVFTFLELASPDEDWRGEIDITGLTIGIEPGVTVRFSAPLQFMIARDGLSEVHDLGAPDGPVDMVIDGDGRSVTETFVNLQLRKIIDFVAAEYEISGQATIDDQLLGRQLRISTPDPVRGLWNSFPDQGYFLVRGQDGSAVRTRPPGAAPGNGVTLELDADGDSSYTALSEPAFWTDLAEGYLWWEPRTGSDPASAGYVTRNASETSFRLAWVNVAANEPVSLSPEIIYQFPLLVDPASSPNVSFVAQSPFIDTVPGTVEIRGAQVVIRTARPLLAGATYFLGISGDVNSITGASTTLFGFPVLASSNVLAVPRVSRLLAEPGMTIDLDGSGSTTSGQPLTYFAWSQVGGPPVMIGSPGSAVASVIVAGAGVYTFQLEVGNAGGDRHYRDVSVHVVADFTAAAAIYYNSSPGDYIGRGREELLSTAAGTAISNVYDPRKVDVVVRPTGTVSGWTVRLCAPSSAGVLTTGNYTDAVRCMIGTAIDPLPGLDFSGEGRGCNGIAGTFDISEIAFAGDGSLLRLAAEFEQRCEGTGPPVRGSVRYHSSVPLLQR